MKVLVTGVKGQLGYDVVKRLNEVNIEAKGVDIDDFDLTNKEQTIDYIINYNPEVVVHCAAFTAVDRAEDDRELCYKINVDGTAYVAEACKKIDAKIVYISTDYVFEGQGTDAFLPDQAKAPINYYGETKSLGEDEITKLMSKFFIIRISWVFGINGNNFVKTMLRLGKEKESITVVNDQIGSPTYTLDLAELIVDMIQTDKYGIYHATNEGYCSWCDFTKEIMNIAGLDCEVIPVTTKEYKAAKAARPYNSRMDKTKLTDNGFKRMRTWQEAVRYYIEQEINQQ